MHCLDCALENNQHAMAVGCCHYCGAAACLDHVTIVQPTSGPIGMVPNTPKRRTVSCLSCTPQGRRQRSTTVQVAAPRSGESLEMSVR